LPCFLLLLLPSHPEEPIHQFHCQASLTDHASGSGPLQSVCIPSGIGRENGHEPEFIPGLRGRLWPQQGSEFFEVAYLLYSQLIRTDFMAHFNFKSSATKSVWC